jgi:hypothetical protein
MDIILLVLISLIVAAAGAYFILAKKEQARVAPLTPGATLTGLTPAEAMKNAEGGANATATNDAAEQSSGEGDSEDEDGEEGEERRPRRRPLAKGARPSTAGSKPRHNQKKAEKSAEKEERRLMQEAAIEERKKKKAADLEKDEQRAKEEKDRQEMEEATLKALREEAKLKKDAEYKQWVGEIAVEEAGEIGSAEDQISNMMKELTTIVQRDKVVVLAELSKQLGIAVDRIVAGIEHQIEQGTLSGVFDDRGKFVYITPKEYDDVARFIRQRGRVSMPELVRECNRLILVEEKKTQPAN